MTTTNSSDYQLKLIGTGLESGTWGESNNENLKRVEAILGGTQSLDITALPIGSTSAASGNSWVGQWVTVAAADTGEVAAEGRCRVVEFTGSPAAAATIRICGSSTSSNVNRVYFIKNSTGVTLTVTDASGSAADVDIPNGKMALVACVSSTTGGFAQGVHNLLDTISQDEIVLIDALTFTSAGTLTIPNGSATALTITDGTSDFVVLDSSGNEVNINVGTVDISNQSSTLKLADSNATALTISDSGGQEYIVIDSSNIKMELNAALDINTNSVDSNTQAVTWLMADNAASALVIRSTATVLVTFDTTTGTNRTHFGTYVDFPDIRITGTDGYINFATTEGSSGYGIRNNSGVLQVKNSGEDWGVPYSPTLASGGGVYFQSSAIVPTAPSTGSQSHGLGSQPRQLLAVLRCTTAEYGWSIGDEIFLGWGGLSNGNRGLILYSDSTNVGYVISDRIDVLNKSTGAAVAGITTGSWDLYIRAWK